MRFHTFTSFRGSARDLDQNKRCTKTKKHFKMPKYINEELTYIAEYICALFEETDQMSELKVSVDGTG